MNADGDVLSTVKVSQSPEEVVTALTEIFGADPEKSSTAPYRYYDWEGFRLSTRAITMDGDPTELHPGIGFATTTKSAYGVDITTVHGISVGDSATTIDADYPKAAVVLCDCDEKTFKFDEVAIDTSDAGYAQQQYVVVTAESPTGKVTSIGAPANNYDA